MASWADHGIEIPASLTGAGGNVNLPCPECQHTRSHQHRHAKPLSVNLVKKTWNCHHCGWRGRLSSQQAPPPGSRQAQAPPRSHTRVVFNYQKGEMAEHAREWLHNRGITDAVIRKRKIGWTMARFGAEEYPAFQFPFFLNGQCVNIKYRTLDKQFSQTPGGTQCLYGLETLADDTDTLIVVEGELDALACDAASIHNVVSLPSGAQISDALFQTIEPLLAQIERVILAGDADEHGQKCMQEFARRIGPEKCWRVSWPEDCKDANATLMTHGQERLWDCLANAAAWPVKGIVEPRELFPAFESLYHYGVPQGIEVPWHTLRHYFKVRQGELTIVTGVPGSGKSTWLSALLVHLAQEEGWRMTVFTPEMLPLERYMVVLSEQYLGKPFNEFPNGPPRMSEQEMRACRTWIQNHFSFLLPEDEAPTVPFLLNLAKIQVLRHGIQAFTMDPWNEMEHSRPAGMTEPEYISQSLTAIRRFARTYGVHTFIVAHPTKLVKKKDGTYPIPTAYDISGAAAWNNKADNIIVVNRAGSGQGPLKTTVMTRKIRFREIGQLGEIDLVFDKSTGRYADDLPYY